MLITAPDSLLPHSTTPRHQLYYLLFIRSYANARYIAHSTKRTVEFKGTLTLLDTSLPGRTFWPVTYFPTCAKIISPSNQKPEASSNEWLNSVIPDTTFAVIPTNIFTSQSCIFVCDFWDIHRNGMHCQINLHILIKSIFCYISTNLFWCLVLSFLTIST